MNNNMAGFKWFSKTLRPRASDECSLSIERVRKNGMHIEKQFSTSQSYIYICVNNDISPMGGLLFLSL